MTKKSEAKCYNKKGVDYQVCAGSPHKECRTIMYLVVASHWTLRTGWQPHWHWLVLKSHMTGRAPDWPGCEGYAPRNLVCSELRHSQLCSRCSLCAHCSGLVPSKALDVGWAEVGLWGEVWGQLYLMDGRNRETGKLLFSGTLSSRGEMIILIKWWPPGPDTRLSLV